MHKKISRMLCFLSSFIIISAFPLRADAAEGNRLVDIYLHASVYDRDGEQVMLSKDDKIEIIGDGKEIPFSIDNGSITATLPLYEKDNSKKEGITEKYIKTDSSIHSSCIKDGNIQINIKDWMFKASKDGEDLMLDMPDYSLNIEGHDGEIVRWNFNKEIDQSYSNDKNTTYILATMGELYEKSPYEVLYGDSYISDYTYPCDNTGGYVREDENGYFIEFNNGRSDVYSIADGTVMDVDDVSNEISIRYNDGIFAVFGNVIPAVEEGDTVMMEEAIGISEESLTLRMCDNGRWSAPEWLYDGFERPEEGPSCPRIYQSGESWSKRTYGYNTIGGGGCGPTSIAMAASGLLGKTYTPDEIVDIIENYAAPGIWYYSKGEGSTYEIFPRVCGVLGLNTEDIGTSESDICAELENGKMVIASISSGRYYHGDGHFILIRGLDSDGNFLINDSSHSFELNEGYSYDDLKPLKSARTIYK